ncbi:MAG: hypothetical protein EBT78_11520 [Betaproteobacteria bacterium]|nr:hypothetical protein [Betaproteobacteria bacterium]
MTDKKTRVATREEKITSPGVYEMPVAPKNKGGRPSTYDPDTARKMCEQLSEGIPLRQICRENEGFPAWRTVYDWMRKDPDLSTSIAHARDVGYDAMAEECLMIADTPLLGEEVSESETPEGTDEDGNVIVRRVVTIKKVDMLGHRKLQIETRLKLLAKFNPKKYGDRVTHSGDDDSPVVIEHNLNVFGDLLKAIKLQRQSSI